MKKNLLLFLALFILLPGTLLTAHEIERTQTDETCPALVETALNAVDEFCADTGRNQACYGNFNLEADAQPTAEDFSFSNIGDIVNVSDIASLRLTAMNTENNEWGVALLRLQTNLPDTLPGQNVTFILFGDVEVVNAVDNADVESGEATPMQAFYLTTGLGDSQCTEAPDSGMIVQTPDGVGEVAFTVNEVDVEMGSTVLFQAMPDDEMIVTTMEGGAALRFGEETFPVIAGTQARMPLGPRDGQRIRPTRLPEEIEVYEENHVRGMPVHLLPRPFDAPPPPLSRDELLQVQQRFREGEALCGEHPFPPCDHLPPLIGGAPCIIPSRAETMTEAQRGDRPICDVEEIPFDQLPLRDGELPPPPEGDNLDGSRLPPPPEGDDLDGSRLPPPPEGDDLDDSRLPPLPDGEEGGDLLPTPDRGGRLPPPLTPGG